MRRAALALVVVLGVVPALAATAQARKPVVAYVDAQSHLVLYDAEAGSNLAAPSLTIPLVNNIRRFSVSFDGRFVVWVDSQLKIHLYDRSVNAERALPGIDVYTAGMDRPAGLSVSDGGLVAFDDNSNGPAVAYDSNARAFAPTGLAAGNGHRQSHLSANGALLATTCNRGSMKCVVEDGGMGSRLFVQNLTTRTDTALADLTPNDEEHPCISGDGRIVGADSGMTKKDVHLYDRTTSTAVNTGGLNAAGTDEVNCVLDTTGSYVGLDDNAGNFRMFDRGANAFVALPATVNPPVWFTSVYTAPVVQPPAGGGTPPAGGTTPDVTAPAFTVARLTNTTFAVDATAVGETLVAARAKRGTTFAYTLSEAARVLFRIEQKQPGRVARGKCAKPSRRNRGGRRCTRLVARGTFAQDAAAGANTKVFSGKLGRRALRPGRYRATMSAADAAGNVSQVRRLNFRIVRR
ncbi:MAG: hypothetical protein QOJ12_1847 [Thermoleophilales bacterium]|nr:hypothetical protein [Thermoleophilales bacterium]